MIYCLLFYLKACTIQTLTNCLVAENQHCSSLPNDVMIETTRNTLTSIFYLFYLFIRLYTTHMYKHIRYLCICKQLQDISVLKVCGLTPTAWKIFYFERYFSTSRVIYLFLYKQYYELLIISFYCELLAIL